MSAVAGRGALVRRLSVGVVDQVLSSGSNFIALLLGARYLNAGGFGSFSVALLGFTITLGVTRALCSESLLVRPGTTSDDHNERVDRATGAAIWVGLASSAIFGVAALFAQASLAWCFLVLAVAMPALMLQDTLRYAAFSRAEPLAATLSDGLWFVGLIVLYGAVIVRGSPSSMVMVAAFVLPGALAGIVAALWERTRPAVGRRVAWITDNRDLSVRYALDFLTGAGAAQLAAYVLVIVAGVAAVGSIRGAQTLFGPVNILLTGAYIVLVPEGRHAARRSKRALTVVCVVASASFALVAAAMLGFYLALTPSQGEMILGSTWDTARQVLVPVGLASIAGGILAGPIAGLRSLAAAREVLRIRFITIPTTVALPVLGAILGDARGLAFGIAISVWWNVGWYWGGYLGALRRFDPTAPDAAGVVEDGDLEEQMDGDMDGASLPLVSRRRTPRPVR